MFGFLKPDYVTKNGYLVKAGDSLEEGTLYVYPNGVVIAKYDLYNRKYLATKTSDPYYYKIDHDNFDGFVVTE